MQRDLWQDARYAARIFWKQPAFAATAVLTLALGIGATTAIFSVVYGVLLKPLPFHEPGGLVSLQQFAPHGAGVNHGPGTYLTYRENQQVFEGIGAWDPAEVSITGGATPERVPALLVSASTLPLLRVQPVLGRAFSAEDDVPGAPRRVLLTHGYSMTQTSFALVMLGIAAGVALLIGMVGIYGAVGYAAAQRTREVGVRMALGAQARDVRTMFLRHGLRLTAIGVASGIFIALVLTRVMSAFLFGVSPSDPITYAAVSAVIAGTTLAATYLPARRASRVDPLVALRGET